MLSVIFYRYLFAIFVRGGQCPGRGDQGCHMPSDQIPAPSCQAPTQIPTPCPLQVNLTRLRDEWEIVPINGVAPTTYPLQYFSSHSERGSYLLVKRVLIEGYTSPEKLDELDTKVNLNLLSVSHIPI